MCSISPSALYGRRRRRCFFLHNSSLHYGCHIDRSQEGREGAGGRWREVGYWLGSTGGGGRGEKGSRRGEKDEMWSKKKGRKLQDRKEEKEPHFTEIKRQSGDDEITSSRLRTG